MIRTAREVLSGLNNLPCECAFKSNPNAQLPNPIPYYEVWMMNGNTHDNIDAEVDEFLATHQSPIAFGMDFN